MFLYRVLSTYFAIVLAAGPGLCCCTPASVAARSTPAVGGHAGTPPAAPRCCQDHPGSPAGILAATPTPGDEAGEHHRDHAPGKHHCPCHKVVKKLDRVAPESSVVLDLVRLLAPVFDALLAAPSGSPVVAGPTASGGDAHPLPAHRVTAWQLLYVHHLLRC